MKIILQNSLITAALTLITILPGCSNRNYNSRTITQQAAYPATLEQAKKDNRYFVMYSGVNIYSITNLELDKSNKQMTVQLDKVDSLHQTYITNNESMRYKPNVVERGSVANILVYMADSTSYTLDEPHTIPLNKVARIELVR